MYHTDRVTKDVVILTLVMPLCKSMPLFPGSNTDFDLPEKNWYRIVCAASIVVAARDHLFARRPQQNRVLVLRRVAALDVDQRRVGADNVLVAEVLERHQVLGLACVCECERAGERVNESQMTGQTVAECVIV